MKRFIEGADRSQTILLPDSLDDYVGEDNPVRAFDAFVEMLDLGELGFDVVGEATGRPGYHPSLMLRIYLYGYLNQVHSSRKLERECGRNLELIWLTGKLKPDFKTIADFRRDNGPAIRKVCQRFVGLCGDMALLDSGTVAIDGSRFKAVNSKARNFTKLKLRQRLGEIDEAVTRYLTELDRADALDSDAGMGVPQARVSRVVKRLARLEKEADGLRSIETRMEETGEKQVSLSDPDARAMAPSKQSRIIGYNVQTAVDAKHHLIVAHQVTNLGHDRNALSMMARAARDVMTCDKLEALADKGYYKSEEIVACESNGIAVSIPRITTSNAAAEGRFDRTDFTYDSEDDIYICPTGQRLTYRFSTEEAGRTMHVYWTTACHACPIKQECTTSTMRRVRRWEHEDVLERVQKRLEDDPSKIPLRSKTVEHPFGTIKSWMGATHFKTRTMKHVATEMALHVLAYNMKRVMAIMGVPGLMKAMEA